MASAKQIRARKAFVKKYAKKGKKGSAKKVKKSESKLPQKLKKQMRY